MIIMPCVKIKQTSSTENAKNHQEDVTELEIITMEMLGEVVRRDTFKNTNLAASAWAGTVRGVGVSAKIEAH